VREAMVCLSQDEDMYPRSIKDNMLMGETYGDEATHLAEAATMGCATELIDKLHSKWETILDPAPVSAQSTHGCGHGYISPAAMEELKSHQHKRFAQTTLSGGEKQRLAA
jgi:ABC-type multidrug transport system fused ATPase/permease subunit